jgi:hypothetical protein
MSRHYHYLGSDDLTQIPANPPYRQQVQNGEDVTQWIRSSQQDLGQERRVTATFIVDLDQRLWIADRHSEHVVCAGGRDVLAAGESTFRLDGGLVVVAEVTNQSTGYCPEPSCWEVLARVLEHIGLAHPAGFTTNFLFRRCWKCGTTNIVKDDWWECEVCAEPPSPEWNYD